MGSGIHIYRMVLVISLLRVIKRVERSLEKF